MGLALLDISDVELSDTEYRRLSLETTQKLAGFLTPRA